MNSVLDKLLAPIIGLISALNDLFWSDIVVFKIGNTEFGLSLMILILIPMGIFFTIRTRFLPFRMFPEMIKVTLQKKNTDDKDSISGLQALIVATATRVGMGNLAGVVAAISFGGPGAVFWMWITCLVGSASAFIESTLAQIYKEKDNLYGGYKGGPAYYIGRICVVTKAFRDDIFCRNLDEEATVTDDKGARYKKGTNFRGLGIAFAISGLICWSGISQVIGNSVSDAVNGAFGIEPRLTTITLVVLAAFIVLSKKNSSVKVLDIVVPVMAGAYLLVTFIIIIINITKLPAMFGDIFSCAFGFKQMVGGGIGAVIMNGVKRGLFSNEAGSGSAPCVSAQADVDHPVKQGLIQALGVFIDTIVICSCSAFIMLLAPASVTQGLEGMPLLQAAMSYHIGPIGKGFIAVILFLFAFSTFLGILVYARSNLTYIFGDKWTVQTVWKVFSLAMLYIGGVSKYGWVWTLGDVGIALMTVFNVIAVLPLSGEAIRALKDYEANHMMKKAPKKQTLDKVALKKDAL